MCGLKNGPKYAYIIYEWSQMQKAPDHKMSPYEPHEGLNTTITLVFSMRIFSWINKVLGATYDIRCFGRWVWWGTVLSEWNLIKPILCTKWPKITMLFYYIEMPTCSCLSDMFLLFMRPFKWGSAWSFISRGIRIITSQSQKLQKRHTLLSKVG